MYTEASRFSLNCLVPAGHDSPRSAVQQLIAISPPFAVLFACCLFWIGRSYMKNKGRHYLFKRTVLSTFVVFYVSYIVLAKAAVGMVYCIEVYDGTELGAINSTRSYWGYDTSIECFQDSHLTLMYVAIPLLFFSLLFPIALAVILTRARSRNNLDSASVVETVGLFFRGFEERYVYWDSVILLRKALIATIVVFSYHLGGNLQGILAVCVLMLSLFLQTRLCPFKRDFGRLNDLESVSLLINAFTFLTGVILNDPNMRSDVVEVLLIFLVWICNVGLISLLLYLVYRAKVAQTKFCLLADGVECQAENDFFVATTYAILCLQKAKATVSGYIKRPEEEDSEDEESDEAEAETCNQA